MTEGGSVKVRLVPYDPTWPQQFARIGSSLARALGPIDHSIEHVGSTSLPGLAAKPVLDIDVIVAQNDVDAAITALEAIGYQSQGDLGVPGRHSLQAPDDDPRRNVYLCEEGCLSVRNHLAVREILRGNRELRDEYAAVKLDLAARELASIDAYIAGKSAVLQKILAEAGLSQTERTDILAVNTHLDGHAEAQ
jgi:GrpB-like predicted nucleotidyltransferase (UPF0157 family)